MKKNKSKARNGFKHASKSNSLNFVTLFARISPKGLYYITTYAI